MSGVDFTNTCLFVLFSAPYLAGSKGGTCSNADALIHSKEECERALNSLGITFTNNWWGIAEAAYSGIAGGCSIATAENKPHLNKLTTIGGGRSDITPICKNIGNVRV